MDFHLDVPRDSDSHTLADYAELQCLATLDRTCSREDIRDRIHDCGDGGRRIDDDALEDAFAQFTWRAEAFGDGYPFALENGRILRAGAELNDPQKLYVLLLLCANLPFVRGHTHELTITFERVTLAAFKALWPKEDCVLAFGKGASAFVGSKAARLNALATFLGGYGHLSDTDFPAQDSGDGGIDIAAKWPLDPFEASHSPTLLVQCACSRENWSSKQTEISASRLGHQIVVSPPWIEAIAIPQSYRSADGRWMYAGTMARVLVFDRLRIINALASNIDWTTIAAPTVLDEFLAFRFDLV